MKKASLLILMLLSVGIVSETAQARGHFSVNFFLEPAFAPTPVFEEYVVVDYPVRRQARHHHRCRQKKHRCYQRQYYKRCYYPRYYYYDPYYYYGPRYHHYHHYYDDWYF